MSVASTYGQMQSTIAFELGGRSDLTTQIQNAIQTAIAKWERKRFYFNEYNGINVFNTVAAQEYYTTADFAAIATIAHIDKIWALVGNNRYYFMPRSMQYLDEVSVNPNVAAPSVGCDYAYYAETLRFYPIPDGAYPISIQGTKRFTALSSSGDSNVWTNDAEALIRTEAKLDIYMNILKDFDQAKAMEMQIYGDSSEPSSVGYLNALAGETFTRIAVPAIRGTYF